ncbi:MAG: ribonuclease P protein component [Candidatus Pacebacteria bacterium]|nr:ribonuclease P protein component [Candidatus Paceibacterota bacterium]
MASIHSQHLTFKSVKDTTINSQFMVIVIVSKKVAKTAVKRNKLKRQTRALFVDSPTKGIVYTKKGVGDLSYMELQNQAKEILKQLN